MSILQASFVGSACSRNEGRTHVDRRSVDGFSSSRCGSAANCRYRRTGRRSLVASRSDRQLGKARRPAKARRQDQEKASLQARGGRQPLALRQARRRNRGRDQPAVKAVSALGSSSPGYRAAAHSPGCRRFLASDLEAWRSSRRCSARAKQQGPTLRRPRWRRL
jgi:hypothetical protein